MVIVATFRIATKYLPFLPPGVDQGQMSGGECAAFMSYAMAFPDGFLSLVDTYDVIRSVSVYIPLAFNAP